jgi:hypothetical protein
MAEQLGKNPPEDWAHLFDRTDDERLEDALLAVRRTSPSHPPTLGELEAAIPVRRTNTEKSVPEQLTTHAAAKFGLELCPHQLVASWNFFGDVVQGIVKGVQIPGCSACSTPSHRVLDTDLPSSAARAA